MPASLNRCSCLTTVSLRSDALPSPSSWQPPVGYVRFDQFEDVLVSTDLLALVAPRLQEQPSHWKWMIIATHSGLQGALVCAIRDTSGTNILKKNSAKARLTWFDNLVEASPPQHLDNFIPLVEKYREKYPDCITTQQFEQISRLHTEFRNNFIHFVPGGWSIESATLLATIRTSLDVLEAAMHQHQVTMRLEKEAHCRLQQNLAVTREELRLLDSL